MILIFDLDDTLYDEKLYAISGFRAVAKYISMTYGVSINESVCILNQSLVSGTRGRAFQDLIVAKSLPKREVNQCIRIYRNHEPDIYLDEVTKETLAELTKFQKYLVTDGNKLVQRKKIKALKLDSFFKRTFTTHSFGLSAAKPSTYCFKLIKDLEEASWSDLVYIGDDPSKDFVNLKPLGVTTVRVIKGRHASIKLSKTYEADFQIPGINKLSEVLGFNNGS
jgi:putative hydrolase of the HAD superfamily